MRTSDDTRATRRREFLTRTHVRGVVADRLIYQDAHVFLSGDVLELDNGLGDRDVLDLCNVLIARNVEDGRRVVRVVGRLLVAGLEEQPARRSTSDSRARRRRGRAGSAHGQPRATNPLTKKGHNDRTTP